MIEQLIEFETAKLLKEKGFRHLTKPRYDAEGNLYDFNAWWDWNDRKNKEVFYACLSQSLVQKWLRDQYYIHIIVMEYTPDNENGMKYLFRLRYMDKKVGEVLKLEEIKADTYEEALEYGLRDALKLIK